VIHLSTLTTQQLVNTPVPEPAAFERNGFDALCQLAFFWRTLRLYRIVARDNPTSEQALRSDIVVSDSMVRTASRLFPTVSTFG